MTKMANTTVQPGFWHSLPTEQALERVKATPAGLSTAEAERRLRAYGPNVLREAEPVRPLTIFMRQFSSLVIWILIGAGLVSGLLGEWVDSIAILAIVALNAVIGFYQEYNSERAIAALKKMIAPHARVRRDGQVVQIPAVEIVPGDIIELEAGDLIPADARLLAAASLRTIEAALTGESEPVSKQAITLSEADTPLGKIGRASCRE